MIAPSLLPARPPTEPSPTYRCIGMPVYNFPLRVVTNQPSHIARSRYTAGEVAAYNAATISSNQSTHIARSRYTAGREARRNMPIVESGKRPGIRSSRHIDID